MGTESLTTATTLHTEQHKHYYSVSSPHREYREPFQNINNDSDNNDNDASTSWSLKRLLSRHGKRRYRVLEREPNRLRKRAAWMGDSWGVYMLWYDSGRVHTYSVLRTPYSGYDDDDRPIRVKGGVDWQNIPRRWNWTKTPIRSKNFPFLSGPFSLKANRVIVEMQENPRIEALPAETITPIQTTHAKKKQPPGPLVHLLAGA